MSRPSTQPSDASPTTDGRPAESTAQGGGRRRLASVLTNGRPRIRAKLQAVAELRGETVEETAERIAVNLLRTVPQLTYYRLDFNELDVADCGFEAGHPWLRTSSGRVFYDYPATAKDGVMYALLRDQVPDKLNLETFRVAAQVIRRYVHGADIVPDRARVVVDAGCYIGYKPIAYADHVGPEGHVIAVEMMPDNFDLLRRNVMANDLGDRISTVNCALSNRTGTVTARRHRYQQATIAEVDQLDKFGADCEVTMDTLANVFDRTVPGEQVDFLNVQVNGNELDVLEGLGPWTGRVKEFSVTSPYSRDGKGLRDQVVDWFRDHDVTVTNVGETTVRARNS